MTAALLLVLVGAAAAATVAAWRHRRRSRAMRTLAAGVARLADEPAAAAELPQPPDHADSALAAIARAALRLEYARRAEIDAVLLERDVRERVLAHLSDGVVLLDGAGRVQLMNRRASELLGLARPAPPGVPLSDASRDPALLELLARRRSGGHAIEGRLALWGSAERLLRAEATPLGPGDSAGVLLVLQDLTASDRLDRMRRDFVANVSHELRTPLTSLRGYAETLLAGGLEDPEHREGFVRVIRDQAMRLQAMTEDLLSLAELEQPGAAVQPRPFDLRAAVQGIAGTFRAEAERRGLALEIEPGDPVPVVADRLRVEQAVANLVDNALKYTESGGVTLRAGRSGARAWCEVADTGPGIPEEDQGRVFERFFRVDRARSRERGGTGLGLSIVKHIAELHGGSVGLVSEVGRGSTFRFELPARLPSRDD